MKFHIVRNKETLDDILYIYNLTKDELVEQNKHIRIWNRLIPGTKLKIPTITEAVDVEVSDMEPFVEDYYPSIANEELKFKGVEEEEYEIINVKKINEEEHDKNKTTQIYKEYEKLEKDKIVENKLPKEEKQVENKKVEILQPQQNQLIPAYYPYYLGVYNTPRYAPYPILYYPVYYQKRPE